MKKFHNNHRFPLPRARAQHTIIRHKQPLTEPPAIGPTFEFEPASLAESGLQFSSAPIYKPKRRVSESIDKSVNSGAINKVHIHIPV